MSATDTALYRLRKLISDGKLQPGGRLPPEAALAAELGVSRSTLREAVRVLDQAQVLDVRRGDGTYVTSLAPHLLLSGVQFAMDLLQGQSLLEVLQVRRLLEPAATALATPRLTPEDFAALRECLDGMQEGVDATSFIECDHAFHSRIVAVTGNQTLATLLHSFSSHSTRANVWRATSSAGALRHAVRQHELIYAALVAGDSALAAAYDATHVAASEEWMRDLLAAAEPRPRHTAARREHPAADPAQPAEA